LEFSGPQNKSKFWFVFHVPSKSNFDLFLTCSRLPPKLRCDFCKSKFWFVLICLDGHKSVAFSKFFKSKFWFFLTQHFGPKPVTIFHFYKSKFWFVLSQNFDLF
jgi:hypothetical protein